MNVAKTDPKSQKEIEGFFGAFDRSTKPLLLLDYDGTLADFCVDRFKARPWAGVQELLRLIQSQTKTRMAVITGRPPEEIPKLLELDQPVEVWGLHGAKRLYPDGRSELEEVSAVTRAKLDEVRARLRSDAFGGLYEDKPNAAVMHWRGIAPAKAKLIEAKTREIFEPLTRMDGLMLLQFEAGLELRSGRDKGGAVREIVREAKPGTPVAYLGDDLTDEAAFRAVNETKGSHLSVLVRREWRETAADVWLRPPGQLKEFLCGWLSATSDQPEAKSSGC